MSADMETIKGLVEITMATYDCPEMQSMPEAHHFEHVAPCYGNVVPGKSMEEQLAESGEIIAVLYWKLAQARGYVPVEENA